MIEKSIGLSQTSLQAQLFQLLQDSRLLGRVLIGLCHTPNEQSLNCLVPLQAATHQQAQVVRIEATVQQDPQNPGILTSLVLQSDSLAPHIHPINITRHGAPSAPLAHVLGSLFADIDEVGFLAWANRNLSHNFENNKQVNLSNRNKQIYLSSSTNKSPSQPSQLPQPSSSSPYYNNTYKHFPTNSQYPNNQNNHNSCYEGRTCKEDSDRRSSQETRDKVKIEEDGQEGNRIFRSAFSSFKPLACRTRKIQQVATKNYQKSQKQPMQDFFKLRSSSFIPCALTREKDRQKERDGQGDRDAEGERRGPVRLQSGSQQEEGEKRHPKPMNKNANLPKFLIRIFIKYVDKFKNLYVKREYDRLYSQCKKMKELKKNDRRQHAFGLKHLKNFFQDAMEGFPDPSLNRRVISKIIDSFLLEQICQNSQIPQSHRVGYLIACRVYSIRCRNASLAGRIQSK